MARIIGEYFRGVSSGFKTINITYPTPVEMSLTPTAITVSSDPGWAGAQISYTVQASDFPTFNGDVDVMWCYEIVVMGVNNLSTNGVISGRYYKNGAALGSSVTTSTVLASFPFVFCGFYNGIVVGDTIKCALFTSGSFSYNWFGFAIFPSRLAPNKDRKILMKDVCYDNFQQIPNFSVGYPGQNYGIYVNPPSIVYTSQLSSKKSFPYMCPQPGQNDLCLWKTNLGDSMQDSIINVQSTLPYSAQKVPSKITYRAFNV